MILPGIISDIFGWQYEHFTRDELTKDIVFGEGTNSVIYFDKKLGLFVQIIPSQEEDKKNSLWWKKEIVGYYGPEGFSKNPDPSIGKFLEPSNGWLFFDRQLRRFYLVDVIHKVVRKSQEYPKGGEYNPIQIGQTSFQYLVNVHVPVIPPTRTTTRKAGFYYPLLVLDETGRIDKFDPHEMKFVGQAGFIQIPPRDLLAYRYELFMGGWDYKGFAVAYLNRHASFLTLDVFDENGRRLKSEANVLIPYNPAYGGIWATTEYLIENLHPPVLDAVTYFTADRYSAIEAQKGIFILPNSHLGELGRMMFLDPSWDRALYPFLVMLPAIILVIILAVLVNKNAKYLGLSAQNRNAWVIGVLAFGLVGYITWRIVRPKIVMVTCQNCGKLRRPDFENCQHCKGAWDVPELVPPSWRVIDGGEVCEVSEKVETSS